MKHIINQESEVTIKDADEVLISGVPVNSIPTRVLSGEWPVFIASELISAWAGSHGWDNPQKMVELYRWRTGALWLETLPDNGKGSEFTHAGQIWLISLDMVLMILMEGVESAVYAKLGADRHAEVEIAMIYNRSLKFLDYSRVTGLTEEATSHINYLFKMATEHLTQQGNAEPITH